MGTAPLVFRLHGCVSDLVREVLVDRGWEEYDERRREEGDWNLYWRCSAFRGADFCGLQPWQRLNHHPRTGGIARKDCLERNLRRMRAVFGPTLYGFSPTTFLLPNNYTRFLVEFADQRRRCPGHSGIWICKPVDLSRGRGIFIFEDIKDLKYDSPVIVQQYISNPLLISGYKFDLRLYVCVKSFHPLTIYMHQEGLVRFATEKFSLASLDNLFAHLTNTSINKLGPFYGSEKDRVGRGCKWTMAKFRSFLRSQGIDELLLWQRINSLVTLTLLTIAPSVPRVPNCIELFGFDVLIDADLKPWLLEVNCNPSLALDCAADLAVKKSLLHDLIDLMSYTEVDGLRGRSYPYPHCGLSEGTSLSVPLLWTTTSLRTSTCRSCPPGGPRKRTCGLKTLRQTTRLRLPNVNSAESEDANSHKSLQPPRRRRALFPCVLPAIHPEICRAAASSAEHSSPPCRVGDFILTFPFNEATLKASRNKLELKVAIQEVQKILNCLTSPCADRLKDERGGRGDGGVEEDSFPTLFWGPRNPPLRRECHFPKRWTKKQP
ncbi:hypothetical protein GN956_G7647 [Arapaima gigas]